MSVRTACSGSRENVRGSPGLLLLLQDSWLWCQHFRLCRKRQREQFHFSWVKVACLTWTDGRTGGPGMSECRGAAPRPSAGFPAPTCSHCGLLLGWHVAESRCPGAWSLWWAETQGTRVALGSLWVPT